MASPEPLVPFKDHCSIIHDNTLYVYSPDAFQSLPLRENATWTEERNGVSVTGALCVKGGLDGDTNNPALYVVGGTANDSSQPYSGVQRYSLREKRWDTINPISAVTANRLGHGATYLNASSAILVYGGSQNGAGASTETFLMLMYPPYRVQAYPSIAPAVSNPYLLGWTEDKALMVGGGANQQVFTFHPDPGWVDLRVTLPNALPDPSAAQVNLQSLDDGTRILQTYYLNQSPNLVTRNVLTDPGFVPAAYGKTIGDSPAAVAASSRFFRRQLIQQTYPAYNSSNAPVEQRTGASLASSGGIVAIVGGDSNSTVAIFDSTRNNWIDSEALFGRQQEVLTVPSSTASSVASPTASQTRAATSAASPPADDEDGQTNGLAILGGVLGGICGLAAILIISLLWLRSVKRRKAAEAAAKSQKNDSPYPNDKSREKTGFGGAGTRGLAAQGQPMGRSPVSSAVIDERDSMAMFSSVVKEKSTEDLVHGGSKLNPNHGANNNVGGFFKSNNRTPLQISKPMLPDLGDYQDRPSVDLGKATPSAAPVLPALAVTSPGKPDDRKTDEGWARYFQADKEEKKEPESGYTVNYEDDPRRSTSRPSTSKGGGTGFWPGAGVPSSNRTTKLPPRDSAGNVLNHATVSMASPNLELGHANLETRNLAVAAPAKAKFSSGDSISTDRSSDDGYEDDDIDGHSDTRDSYRRDTWNPLGNTWSGPNQRPLRPPSVRSGATAFPPPTSISEQTINTSSSGNSSIPAFPMPARLGDHERQFIGTTTVYKPPNPYTQQHARKSSNTYHEAVTVPRYDYFGPPPGTASSQGTNGKPHDSNDMSWLNLGMPAHVYDGPHTGDSRDPA